MTLGNMEDDRPGLEQGEIAFLIGRNLTERMKRQMRGFLHRTERHKANLVGLAHFFERPVCHAPVPLPPSGERSKAVMVMVIVRFLVLQQDAPSEFS
jgi:hypothetical protein